jgi:hypothetical protein
MVKIIEKEKLEFRKINKNDKNIFIKMQGDEYRIIMKI